MANMKKPSHEMNKRINLKKVMPSDEYSLKIMAERSKSLAKSEADDSKKLAMVSYIRFRLGANEFYGIPYSEIEDVKNVESITRVPKAPNYIAGIHYWHGKIIPVINLAKYFNIPDAQQEQGTPFVATVSAKNRMLGFVFHDVVGVDAFPEGDLDENIAASSGIKNEYIYGIHMGRTTILNARNILDDISRVLMNKKGDGHE